MIYVRDMDAHPHSSGLQAPRDQRESRLLDVNVSALWRSDPALAAALKDSGPRSSVELAAAEDGGTVVIMDGEPLTSRYSPMKEAKGMLARLVEAEPELAAIVGMANIDAIDLICKNFSGPIYCLEPRLEIVRAVLENLDLSEHLAKGKLRIWTRPEEVNANLLADAGHKLISKLGMVVLSSYRSRYAGQVESFRNRIENMVRQTDMLIATLINKSEAWGINAWKNLPHLVQRPGIEALISHFSDVPAILVAAGPSLSRNIHLLRQAKGRALIICVGTALPRLRVEGIVPDLVCALESNELSKQFQPDNCSGLRAAFSYKCWPDVFTYDFRDIFTFGSYEKDAQDIYRIVGKKGLIPIGGSVATAAFSISVVAGCNPVILIGQDLSFGSFGEGHASGTGNGAEDLSAAEIEAIRSGDEGRLKDNSLYWVDGFYGEKVLTRINWLNYLHWFERQIRELSPSNIKVINATEGGVAISGARHLSLADALELYAKKNQDIEGRFESALAGLAQPAAAEVIRRIKEVRQAARKGISIIEKSVPLCKSLFLTAQLTRSTPPEAELFRLGKLERKLTAAIKPLDKLIEPFMIQPLTIYDNVFKEQDPGENDLSRILNNLNVAHMVHRAAGEALGKLIGEADRAATAIEDAMHRANSLTPRG